jgi:hypothetical protein
MRAVDSAGSAWVSQNRELVDRAVLQFQATGEWPLIREFQRQLDRQGLDSNVEAAASSMPSLVGGASAPPLTRLAIPLWLMRFVDTARPLTQMAMIIVKRAVALYLSPDQSPRLRSDDPAICQQAPWPDLVLRAGDLVRVSQPTPFASGTRGEDGWNYALDEGFTSRLKDVETLDDYVKCQAEWLKNSAGGHTKVPATPTNSRPPNTAATERSASAWLKVLIAGIFVLAAAALGPLTATWISHNGSAAHQSVPGHSPSLEHVAGILINPHVVLTKANFCSWRFATHPMPLASARPVRVRIDDRCNLPKDPNPATDSPTDVYSVANQSPNTQVGSIKDGQIVTIRCYVLDGTGVSDAVGDVSHIWLGLVSPHGLIPDVNVGGGYSEAQLRRLGVPRC